MAKKSKAEERRARAAALREAQRKKDRRNKALKIAGASVAGAAVLGLLGTAIFMELKSRNIEGVAEYEVGDFSHVDVGEKVDYEQSPPVGGQHWPYWQNCGVYTDPITPEFGVHSLEHGAVWINYDPELPEEKVTALEGFYNPGDYLLVTPYEGDMDAPIVASSWGRQISVDAPDDENLLRFVQLYERGTDVPEPGAACSGSVQETQADFEAQLAEQAENPEALEGAENDDQGSDPDNEDTDGEAAKEDEATEDDGSAEDE
ncbi:MULTISPECIES: DUF3105 domain-containing protein [Nocardiopsis]|uniref:DUF3105 domain-containing protein n=3 Tax=Nocardiopsis alba TaxID=53437 RepID=A0A7K2IUZ7_9ACTN|nr:MULTISPECIES: DUF3105 domain-containing protein [Nocardiopsis]MEC3895082.1 DUF3105 domain-containing protein [Nocardiopsis sp. LDBS1602]MYR33799.1 DUF3105 domain-containing protein [Nocardiopsis alba]